MTQILQNNESHPNFQKKPKNKAARKKQYTAWVISLFSILFIVMTLVIIWPKIDRLIHGAKFADYNGSGNGKEVIIQIPKDATGKEIGTILYEKDIVASARAFTTAFTENPRANSIQAGTFKLQQKMSGVNAVSALLDPANRAELRITIPEGFKKNQVFQRIASVLQVQVSEVEKAAADGAAIGLPAEAKGNIEGWIAPLTYELNSGATVTDVLKLMVGHQVKTLKSLGVSPDKWERLLTVASIVEREVNWPEYYGKVARVIENRLVDTKQVNGRLQMDSTVLYAVGKSGGIPTSAELKKESPYNTYLNPGLPPTPISSPSKKALQASINPPAGDWLYFVTVNLKTGETKFTNDHEEHKKNVAEFRSWYEKNRN